MSDRSSRTQRTIFSLAGWLFADLLLALALLFMASATPWVATANAKVTPTPVPKTICGIEKAPQEVILTASDPYGVRQQTSAGLTSFIGDVKSNAALRANANRIAGLIEVFGGSTDPGDGTTFAAGAIRALQLMQSNHFIVTDQTAFFKPLWSGAIGSNQIDMFVFYFRISASCSLAA